MQIFNCTNLPVQEENKEDYRKAITRMRGCGICVEVCWPGDIIAYQEQEIKRYRTEVERLREMIEDTKRDENVQIEGCMCELAADGLPRISKDDTLILKANVCLTKEKLSELQREITDRTGMKIAVVDTRTDLIGVIENGT